MLTSDTCDEHTLEEWNIENLEVSHTAIVPAVWDVWFHFTEYIENESPVPLKYLLSLYRYLYNIF